MSDIDDLTSSPEIVGSLLDKSFIINGIEIESSYFLNVIEDSASTKIGFPQVGTSQSYLKQSNISQNGLSQISSSQISFFQPSTSQIGTIQVGTTQIDTIQGSTSEITSTQINVGKTSFSNVIAFQHFLSRHNTSPTSIYDIDNTALTLWNTSLQTTTPLNLNIEIADLSTGQLAEANITGFDPTGRPNSGTLDTDAKGLGWFIDSTPWDNSEYSQTLTDTAYRATADSA